MCGENTLHSTRYMELYTDWHRSVQCLFGRIFVLIWLMSELVPWDPSGERRVEGWACYWYHQTLQKLQPGPAPDMRHWNQLIKTTKTVSDVSTGRPLHQISCTQHQKISLHKSLKWLEALRLHHQATALSRAGTGAQLDAPIRVSLESGSGHQDREAAHYTWMVTLRVD